MIEKEQTFFEYVYDLFYEAAKSNPEDVSFVLSRKIQYPVMNFAPKIEISMPLPKLQNDKYVFEGMVFENTDKGRYGLWGLFLASVYHLAAHVAVSEYSFYKQWSERKTEDIYSRVVDFIEDIVVERYIFHTYPEVWKNIENINSIILRKNSSQASIKQDCIQSYFSERDKNKIEKIKQEILQKRIGKEHKESILPCVDMLYKNRDLLPQNILPYHERHRNEQTLEIEKKGIRFEPHGVFEEIIQRLDELWETNEQSRNRLLRRYRKYLKDLNFDAIIIPSGNLHVYSQLKAKTLPMLRRIRQQIRQVSNLEDDPKIDEIGFVNMQYAIQGIASENRNREIFDRDEMRRGEEAWIILVDSSASMQLKFDKIKEFAVCISESASELTGKSNAWALYSFDNNFSILKDFEEKYNNDVKARIGDLKTGGLSFLPDAIELASRILDADPRERKYIFIITDGHPSGYEQIESNFAKTVKTVEMSGVTLVAIGLTKEITRSFRNNAKGTDLKQLVSKFITAYRSVSTDV